MEDSLYAPTFGFFLTILCLNVFQCVFGVRRIRVLEQRVFALENKTAEQENTANPSAPPSQTQPRYTYVQPPVYQYYQQPMAAPPTATAYYPQDPQNLQTRY